MATCGCGCGGEVREGVKFLHAHHWRAKRREARIPTEKVCERCGRTYKRSELANRQSNKHWLARKFCGEECRRADRSERSRSQRGEQHPGWKGDGAKPQSGRMRARRLYGTRQPCRKCGRPGEIHHIDGNPLNNEPENIAWLCRQHHFDAEDRMAYRRTAGKSPEQLKRDREKARRHNAKRRARKQ